MSGELIHSLERFATTLKDVREKIADMDEDELIEFYHTLTRVFSVAWYIRCMVVGIAKEKSGIRDGSTGALAKAFGVGERMIQLDVNVYQTFMKDNEEFDPVLPASFYQLASKTETPQQLIEYAVERRMAHGFTASQFAKLCKGDMPVEKANPGTFKLVPVEGQDLFERTELTGRINIFRSGGNVFIEIT